MHRDLAKRDGANYCHRTAPRIAVTADDTADQERFPPFGHVCLYFYRLGRGFLALTVTAFSGRESI
jgi:hypothetical protein